MTRTRVGETFTGVKTGLRRDLLSGASAEQQRRHCTASRPGVAETDVWVGRVDPVSLVEHPYFSLLALRSRFVRARSGHGADPAASVPVTSMSQCRCPRRTRERLDAVSRAHAARLAARRTLDGAAAAYESWGDGALDDAGRGTGCTRGGWD